MSKVGFRNKFSKRSKAKSRSRSPKNSKSDKQIFSDSWVDVIEFAKENNTWSPNQVQLLLLKKGDFVKIGNGTERFWVIIKKIDKDQIIGEINNELVFSKTYDLGDLVEFTRYNVYDILLKKDVKKLRKRIGGPAFPLNPLAS